MTDGIKGENVLIAFWDGADQYLPFACASSITINFVSDKIGKSTVGSGKWKESEAVSLGWNFTIGGIAYLNQSGYKDFADMIAIWKGMLPINIQFTAADTSGNQIIMSGDALIDPSLTGSVNNFANATITGEGTGELMDVS